MKYDITIIFHFHFMTPPPPMKYGHHGTVMAIFGRFLRFLQFPALFAVLCKGFPGFTPILLSACRAVGVLCCTLLPAHCNRKTYQLLWGAPWK